MNIQGKIVNWNDDKGFGFVEPIGGGERAFVHIKAFAPQTLRPINGDLISYQLIKEANQRHRADTIKFVQANKGVNKTKKQKNGNSFATLFTVIFCAALVDFILIGKLPLFVGGIYVAMSLVAFVSYARDKSAAQAGRWRVQENTLHLFSLIGGWPGAFLAQKILRHKSSKGEFKLVYWLTVMLNLSALFLLYSETGVRLFQYLIIPLLHKI